MENLTSGMCIVSHRSEEQVAGVMVGFKGKVRQMLCHSDVLSVVEYAYNEKAILRLMLTEELYGTTFQVFKVRTRPTPLPRAQCNSVVLKVWKPSHNPVTKRSSF